MTKKEAGEETKVWSFLLQMLKLVDPGDFYQIESGFLYVRHEDILRQMPAEPRIPQVDPAGLLTLRSVYVVRLLSRVRRNSRAI